MEWVETTGKSVQEAKDVALDELGVDEADAEFEVLAEAQTGLFGRLRSEARVRARVRPTAPRAKEDRRDRRRRNARSSTAGPATGGDDDASSTASTREPGGRGGGNGGSRNRGGRRSGAGAGAAAGEARSTAGSAGDAPSEQGTSGSGEAAATTEVTASGPSTEIEGRPAGDGDGVQGEANRNRRRRGGRNGSGSKGTGQEGSRSSDGRGSARSGDDNNLGDDDLDTKGTGVEVDLDRQAEVAVDFLNGLTREFGLQASVQVTKPDEDTVELQLSGSDLGILIGPKGATLVALQNLTRTVVFNETGGNNGHIDVDISGYRQKRSEALARFATQIADTVKESGKRTALEPMTAIDRKVVHDTIAQIDGVTTASEGEEPRRRVVVLPG